MMIYTSRKRNKEGQRALDCCLYNCSSDIEETCLKEWSAKRKLTKCRVRFGDICTDYAPSGV